MEAHICTHQKPITCREGCRVLSDKHREGRQAVALLETTCNLHPYQSDYDPSHKGSIYFFFQLKALKSEK